MEETGQTVRVPVDLLRVVLDEATDHLWDSYSGYCWNDEGERHYKESLKRIERLEALLPQAEAIEEQGKPQ